MPARHALQVHSFLNLPVLALKRSEVIILSVLFFFYLLWFAIPVSVVGTDDFRMVDAFNVDESEFLQLLKNEVKSHEFNMHFYMYSHLYFNTGLLPLIVWDFFSPVSEQHIVILFRLLSALYFLGTVLVVFLIGKKFFGKITAWLSVILLLTISSLLFAYSSMLHPDTAQLFFISLGIYFCCRYFDSGKQWKHLAFAAFAAGLAFGTKYAGIMLMPVIAGIDLLVKTERQKIHPLKLWSAFFFCFAAALLLDKNLIMKYVPFNENSEGFYLLAFAGRILSMAGGGLILAYIIFRKKFLQNNNIGWFSEKLVNMSLLSGIFIIAFALSSPGCLSGLNFVNGFINVTDLARYGHWFRVSLGVKGWLEILVSRGVLNYVVFLLFASNLVLNTFLAYKYGIKRIASALVLFSWILIYFITLVLRINADFSHYLIPILPFMILLAANSMEWAADYVAKKIPAAYSRYAVVALSLLLLGYNTFFSAREIYTTRNSFVNKVKTSDAVKAGLWLLENFPPETRILYDRYAYIPSEFNAGFASWGITEKQVFETMPGLIVINSQIYQNYLNPDSAASFLAGSGEYLEKYNFYKLLLDEKPGFTLLRDFGKIKIYSGREWKKKVFFQVENNYESPAGNWDFHSAVIDSTDFFSGKRAERLTGEYSATFGCPLENIFGKSLSHPLYVNVTVRALMSKGSSAILIIDFIRDGKSLSWQGKNFSDFVPEPGQWLEINFSRQIPADAHPSDQVRIYVWNTSGKPVLLDDFTVEAYAFE